MSPAHQAFQRGNQDAHNGVGEEPVMNPVPGEPNHLVDFARGEHVPHAAVWTAARRWNQ